MSLGADDLKPGLWLRQIQILPELDVGTPPRHVGRDRDRCLLTRTRDDLGLALMVLGVEDLMPQAATLELPRERLGDIHVDRADQDRPAEPMQPLDFVHDGVVLFLAGLVDAVRLIDPLDGPVSRDDAYL